MITSEFYNEKLQVLDNKVKHNNLPTHIYEDTKHKIEFGVNLAFNENKSYLKK